MRKTLLKSVVALLILSAFSVTSFFLGAQWAALSGTNGQLMMNVHIAELLRENEPALALTELEHVSSGNIFVLKDYGSPMGSLMIAREIVSLPFNKNALLGDYRKKAASYLSTYPNAAYDPIVVAYLDTHYPQSPASPAQP